jgi:Zn/Cd-binding protein ZinT
MTTKYEIKRYGPDRIVPITCTKETEKTLWIEYESRGRKGVIQRRKCSDFHDTWQSAYDCLIVTTQDRITCAKRDLQQAEAELAELKTLNAPQP